MAELNTELDRSTLVSSGVLCALLQWHRLGYSSVDIMPLIYRVLLVSCVCRRLGLTLHGGSAVYRVWLQT
ncbi:hypothetical protein J6590_032340 [Homalodisca vitripennis]|nr:hypothetical protein J6590_032340 [Homalodisca vitripennis]